VHLRPRLSRDLQPQLQNLVKGGFIDRDELLRKLVSLQYTATTRRSGAAPSACAGDTLEVFPAYAETAFRATLFGDEVERLQHFDPLTGELILDDLEHVAIWPATHYNVKEGTIEARGRRDRRELNRALRRARGRGQAARVPPPAPAHPVRHGDAARGRLLLGHRELLADPRRPAARRAARTA
jgi:excinuclease UvrABC helicase subunit UvrB